MMKPNFDDVIEYVKAGEDDPDMEETLRLHPDGQELLKQARFICAVLRRLHGEADDGDLAASAASVADAMRNVAASRDMESMRESFSERALYQSAPMRRPKRQPQSIGQMIDSEGRSTEDLGTLEFAEEGETVVISYEPTDSVMMRYGKPLIKYALAQADIDGIEIRGQGITLTLPDKLPAGERATLQVTRGLKRLPARRLEFIFMPESGPFERLKTDDDGLVELPVPDQAGTLRIDSPSRQILHIKIKK